MSFEQKFEVLELIGRGSFGNVRKVRRISDGRLCVRKEISYIHMNPKERSQLIDEFRILGSLNHPNIVEYIYHEHVPEDHMVYLYMEYCDGGDLSQIIKSHKKREEYVPEDLIWSIFTQVIMALYRCHYGVDPPPVKNIFQTQYDDEENEEDGKDTHGPNNQYKYSVSGSNEPTVVNNEMIIIHRDIKPDNVFLLKDNFVKLGDFGLAKLLLSESDFATTYVGTPYYMSPEVLMDKPYTPLSDIWSLGCVMYELCALHPPFQAKTHLQLQNRIKEGHFPDIPSHYSQKLRLTINACISVDTAQRPSSYLLLQEISIKIFRKELELNTKQQNLASLERSLKLKENAFLQERSRLSNEIDQELGYHKKIMDKEIEQIRLQYQKEFQYVVEKEVNNRIKILLQEPEFMQQIINQATTSGKMNDEYGKPNDLLSKKSTGVLKQWNGPGLSGSTITSAASTAPSTSSNNSKYSIKNQSKLFDEYSNPNVYGGVTGNQNLNMNGGNALNKATHSSNAHVMTKKKKYYNEMYEENTPSPFLRTFNSNF
ncbi:serine/threonine protein kinase [Saccharomycopsis crataegensis]|uniref:non-specific serine/threonine protein kinase n=1 Tax=Saccharomycopsis crataegensis TaxID=43959 RepID=A0AAV5QRR5_9ASCO|nr:serine/threonine protein kinase [Saccharomycopsis crataegensis]